MDQNKNLPGAGDRSLSQQEHAHQEQAFGLVMAVVPVTFILIIVGILVFHF